MEWTRSPVTFAYQAAVSACRKATAKISLTKWMLVLVGVTVVGYVAFGIQYYLIDRSHRELLTNNSIYIQFENDVRAVASSYQIAQFAAANARALPAETLRAAANEYVAAVRAAWKANKVAALEFQLKPILASAEAIEGVLSQRILDAGKIREALDEAAQMLGLLVMIASEGRKAEWEDLLAGSQSDFKVLTALIAIGISVVGLVGYLMIMTVRRTFTDVIRINSAIARGALDVDIPPADGATEAGQMYAALRLFRGSLVEKARLEIEAKSAESARYQRHQRVEAQIDSFRRQAQELLASVGSSMEQMQSTAKTLAMAAEETSARAIGAANASNEASLKIRTAAKAAEELAVSVRDVNQQIGDTTSVVGEVTQ